jgi:hypothetical protein
VVSAALLLYSYKEDDLLFVNERKSSTHLFPSLKREKYTRSVYNHWWYYSRSFVTTTHTLTETIFFAAQKSATIASGDFSTNSILICKL